ncbi:MAG: hypothetical protein QM640_08200 [Niabella sp.]
MLTFFLNGYGQLGDTGFTAFGAMPVKTPDSLFKKIQQAGDNITSRSGAVLELLSFHADHGTNDYVIFYAHDLDNELRHYLHPPASDSLQ